MVSSMWTWDWQGRIQKSHFFRGCDVLVQDGLLFFSLSLSLLQLHNYMCSCSLFDRKSTRKWRFSVKINNRTVQVHEGQWHLTTRIIWFIVDWHELTGQRLEQRSRPLEHATLWAADRPCPFDSGREEVATERGSACHQLWRPRGPAHSGWYSQSLSKLQAYRKHREGMASSRLAKIPHVLSVGFQAKVPIADGQRYTNISSWRERESATPTFDRESCRAAPQACARGVCGLAVRVGEQCFLSSCPIELPP